MRLACFALLALVGCAEPPDPVLQWHVARGDEAYSAGDFTRARMAYEAARELAPTDGQLGLYFYRAQTALAAELDLPISEEHKRLNDHWIDLLLERFPEERARWLTARGNFKRGFGEAQAAIAALTAAREADPTFEPAVWLSADLLTRLERPVEAEALLAEARASFPKSVRIRTQLAALMETREAHDAALEMLTEALRIEPGPAIHVQMGQLLLAADDPRRAEAAFREALKLAPDLPPAMAGLGYAKLARGDKEQARMVFERYLSIGPARGVPAAKLDEVRMLVGGLGGATPSGAAAPEEVPGMPGMRVLKKIPVGPSPP